MARRHLARERRVCRQVKPLLANYERLKELPRRERLTARPSLAKLFAKVSDRQTRNERTREALRVHGYTLQEVGDAVGLHTQP